MKTSQRLALCGVVSALAAVMLLMTVFPYATYALAAMAGIVLIPAALECGTRYAVLSYIATAMLALLITPDIEAKWLFILFFGYYPIVHLRLQIRRGAWVWGVKLVLFNLAAVADFLIMTMVLNVPREEFVIAGVYVPWVLLIAANAVFVLYDMALYRVSAMYRVRLHPLVKKMMK